MRVALVSEHASPLAVLGGVDAGGQNVHVAALAQGLARRGATVVVHTRRDDPATPRRVALCPGVEVDHVPTGPAAPVPKDDLLPYMDAFAAELERAWRRERPDVVHSHFWMSGLATLQAAHALDIPVVHTFHALGVVKRRYQGDADTSPAERLDVERAIVRGADRIVATCTDEAFELLRLGAERGRVHVVPCGVDLERFRPDGPTEPRGRRHRIVYIGRLVERKGIGNVISALESVPDCELVVAGGPPRAAIDDDAEARRLRALAALHGVDDRVTLLGRVDRADLPALLRSADALVTVPWYEPFGITPVEAMACATPVIGADVGGIRHTVRDGETGFLVPPRDPDALAARLEALRADPGRACAMGEAGRRRANAHFTWRGIARELEDVYLQVAPARVDTSRDTRVAAAGGAQLRAFG